MKQFIFACSLLLGTTNLLASDAYFCRQSVMSNFYSKVFVSEVNRTISAEILMYDSTDLLISNYILTNDLSKTKNEFTLIQSSIDTTIYHLFDIRNQRSFVCNFNEIDRPHPGVIVTN